MKIGVFGGSFNPPHKMHIEIAEYLLTKKYVDRIIFVPTGSKYKYKNNLESDADRYNMLNLAIKNNFMKISSYELQDYAVYTHETLSHIKKLYPNDTICFICGMDNLSYIDTWKNADYILNNFSIIVINRKNNNLDSILKKLENYQQNIKICDLEMKDVSSTMIRELLKEKKDVSKYLDKDVEDYIKTKKLYKGR